jgi:hypothetical protein
MKYVIQEVGFALAQRGIVSEAIVRLPTSTQSTNVTATVRSGGPNTLAAAFNLWRAIRTRASFELEKDGDWSGQTTDFRRGLFWSSAR